MIGGHSSYHFYNWVDAPFTRFLENNKLIGCFGLSIHEILVLENFNQFIDPKGIIVIGNGHGFSSIALSLIFPQSKVVSIDPDAEGVEVTNRLCRHNDLEAQAVVGRSPKDTLRIVRETKMTAVDFALIDGVHTSDAITADFRGLQAVANHDCLYVFHDIINHNLIDGFNKIQRESGFEGMILTRTPSGIGVISRKLNSGLREYLKCFSDPPDIYRKYRSLIRTAISDPIAGFETWYGNGNG